MTRTAAEIIARTRSEGVEAYLWVHDSGDVILWHDEASSEGDDGAHAVARWQVDADTVADLLASGEAHEA
jgi:hypothetical protein